MNRKDLLLSPPNDLVMETIDHLKEHLRQEMVGGVKSLCLDLSAVKRMDSTGAGLMFTVIRWLGEKNQHVKVKNASDDLRWVMKITGLESLLIEGDTRKGTAMKAS